MDRDEPPTPPSGVPSEEKLDTWIKQNRRFERRSRLAIVAVAVALAVSVGGAVENAIVLRKLDERGARNRDLIERIDKNVENTQALLDFTDGLDSPETRAAQAAATQELLDAFAARIDCQTREALLDAISDVFGRDAAASYRAKIEALCQPSAPPGGTTTTSPTGG